MATVTFPEVKKAIELSGARWVAGPTGLEGRSRRRNGGIDLSGTGPQESPIARRIREKPNAAIDLNPGLGAYPASFDLRHVGAGDLDFTSAVKRQDDCAACVGFAVAATIEATIRKQRNEPGATIDLSAAQLFFCYGVNPTCDEGVRDIEPVLQNAKSSGISRNECYRYSDRACKLRCPDPTMQMTTIADYVPLATDVDKKTWISTNGPLIAVFKLFEDFTYYRSGIYRHVIGPCLIGHCVSVVGYNDPDRYWICQNSKGDNWGEDGFFCLEYDEPDIDPIMWGIVPV